MPTLPWTRNKETPDVRGNERPFLKYQKKLEAIPAPLLALTAFLLGSVTTISATLLYRRYGKRFRNSEWITPDVFAKRRWVKGVVTAVGDADNFRLYHTPGIGWQWPLKIRRIPSTTKDLKDQTLHIRIAGVDAPEAAHFGRPAQPFSAESLAWLRKTVLGKVVYCQLLHRDQYSRVVANVTLPPRILPTAFASGKSLSLEMLKSGWVTTYEQAGAEYGKWGKEEFLRVEAEAKAARRGMWKNGVNAETPAEYKRRFANSQSMVDAKAVKSKDSSSKGWLRRLLGL